MTREILGYSPQDTGFLVHVIEDGEKKSIYVATKDEIHGLLSVNDEVAKT